jgi:DNA polymerase III epsilon subunit-like protein
MTVAEPAAFRGRKLAVVDVEGNGQRPPEIIEIAVLPVDDGTAMDAMYHWLIRPAKPITPVVTRKVHGITNADVASSPRWSEVAGNVEAALAGRALVAHNASVELAVVGAHLPNWRPTVVLDTLRLAKHVMPGLPGYGLNHLVAELQIDTSIVDDQHHHRARYDVWCAWQLLCLLAENGRLDWPALVEAASPAGYGEPREPHGGLW